MHRYFRDAWTRTVHPHTGTGAEDSGRRSGYPYSLNCGEHVPDGTVLEVLQEKCTGINITIAQDKADYFLEASNQPPDVRYVLFNKEGDAIFLASPRHPDNAVKDVCQYLGHLKK